MDKMPKNTRFIFVSKVGGKPAEDEEAIQDVHRTFLTPKDAKKIRRDYELKEIFDNGVALEPFICWALHVNVCEHTHKERRDYIAHACMYHPGMELYGDEGDELNVAYTFVTYVPTVQNLIEFILLDFGTYLSQLRQRNANTVH